MKTLPSALALFTILAACESRKPEPRFVNEPLPAATTPERPVEPRKQAAPEPSAAAPAAAVEPAPAAAPAPEASAPTRLVREPSTPDPLAGKFALRDATKGLPAKGALRATIETGYGKIECKLFDDKAPNTVANFVGLARGLRPFWDEKTAAWVKRPLYDGTSFHRAVADFMIQGGDQLGDGSGGVGYEIADELVPGWSHDRAGLLCMANRGPNTNGGQFFITDGAAPHLTQMKTFTIFGECAPLDVIQRIARAPRSNPHAEEPSPSIPIKHVEITRK